MPGFRYTPFASLSEEFARRSVTCASPSKAFNLAGVQVANIFAADAGLRERIARSLEINETGMISPFAIEALTAAYTDGAEWLDALNGYLWENYLFLRDYFARHLPQFPVLPLEGTYLVWADCRAAGLSSDTLTRRLLDEGRLHVNSGRRLHPPEHRLPAQTAGRGSRPPEKGSDGLKNGWLSEKYCYLCTS